MSTLFLDVIFSGSSHSLTYVNPADWECLTFEECLYWKPVESISWTNLPTDKFVVFYESSTCFPGGTHKYFYRSKTATGTHEFDSPRNIRSIMVGRDANYPRLPSAFNRKCSNRDEFAIAEGLNDTAAHIIYGADGTDFGSTDAGGLSSNWTDSLPDNL